MAFILRRLRKMLVELFKLAEGLAVLTTVTIAAISVPTAIITGEDLPDIAPLLTLYEHDDKRIYPEVYQHEENVLHETP